MKRSWSPESNSIKQGRPCALTPAAAHHLWDEATSERGDMIQIPWFTLPPHTQTHTQKQRHTCITEDTVPGITKDKTFSLVLTGGVKSR